MLCLTAPATAQGRYDYNNRPSLPNPNARGFGQTSHWLERPGATRNTADLSQQVEGLLAKYMQAKSAGNLPGAAQTNAALQNLLRQLTSMEPHEAKWHVLQATTFINQAGGPSRSGTAGDRASLKFALRELDLAAACPNANQFSSQIANIRTNTEKELARRVAKGIEIQRRGARQFAEIYSRPGGSTESSSSSSLCTVCGHFHGSDPGACNYRRD